MPDFSKLREKMRETFNVVADKTVEVAGKTTELAKAGGRIAKLSIEVRTEQDALKKTYAEIGKLYYDTHKDAPDGFYAQLCDEVRLNLESIAAKEAEIADLKAQMNPDEAVDVEFEEVVAETETAEAPAEPEVPTEPETPVE